MIITFPLKSPKYFLVAIAVYSAVCIQFCTADQSDLPDLAKLKLAAESGDPVAQFDYGRRISSTNRNEQEEWYQRSADQGYAPAQDAVGAHYTWPLSSKPKERLAMNREAVRWTSRAAFQGYPAAQLRLSRFYIQGTGVAADPVAAYMWAQIVLDNPNSSSGERTMANLNRDSLIANTTLENIREGQRRAASFAYPARASFNPIEVELLVAQLKLIGIFHQGDQTSAAVNNVRFYIGDSKEVKVDEHVLQVTCISIQPKSAQFRIAGTDTDVMLFLKR